MTLHDVLKGVSDILTPKTGSLYRYALYSCEDIGGGHVRTRPAKWGEPVPDKEVGDSVKCLVCFDRKFTPRHYYKEDGMQTDLQMQLFYGDVDINADIEWCRQMNFCHAYIFHLDDKTYTYKYLIPR